MKLDTLARVTLFGLLVVMLWGFIRLADPPPTNPAIYAQIPVITPAWTVDQSQHQPTTGPAGSRTVATNGPTALINLPADWRPDLTAIGISNEQRDQRWHSNLILGEGRRAVQYFGRYQPGAAVQRMIVNGEPVTIDFSYVIVFCAPGYGALLDSFPIITTDGYYYPLTFFASGRNWFITRDGRISPLEDAPGNQTIYGSRQWQSTNNSGGTTHHCERDISLILWPR